MYSVKIGRPFFVPGAGLAPARRTPSGSLSLSSKVIAAAARVRDLDPVAASGARRPDLDIGARPQIDFHFLVAREIAQIRFPFEEPPP